MILPVPSDVGINRRRAIWYNRYVLETIRRILQSTIRPGGMLKTLYRTR